MAAAVTMDMWNQLQADQTTINARLGDIRADMQQLNQQLRDGIQTVEDNTGTIFAAQQNKIDSIISDAKNEFDQNRKTVNQIVQEANDKLIQHEQVFEQHERRIAESAVSIAEQQTAWS